MARKLKVFRTPIGFHDAYVAAPSQKAALAAWGSDADLFARGIAEVVTDEALTEEPLANPGEVIKRPRGSAADYMSALSDQKPVARRKAKPTEDDAPPQRRFSKRATPEPSDPPATPEAKNAPARSAPKRHPRPRPSRDRLDAAEQAIERANSEHDEAAADLRRREQALRDERRHLDQDHAAKIKKLEDALEKARNAYQSAIE